MRNRCRARLRDERGYSFPELITAGALSVMLVGTFGALIVTAAGEEPEIAERSAQVQQGRVALEKITRELREAYVVNGTPSASQLSVNTFVRSASCGGGGTLADSEPAIACRVTFSCTTTACTRTEANPDGTGPGSPVVVVDGLRSASVFTYDPPTGPPSHVTVTLSYPGDVDGESITVSDGAELRNDR